MCQHLNNILMEIRERIKYNDPLPYEKEFIIQLQCLDNSERSYVSQKCYKLEWDIGSPHIFAILQKQNLFQMSVYLLKQESTEEILNVLNDLLETEYTLLADVFINCQNDNKHCGKLFTILEDFFRDVIRDILFNPELAVANYLLEVKNYVDDCCLQPIRDLHLKQFMQLDKSSLENAITKQHDWNSTIAKNSFLSQFIDEILFNRDHSLQCLLCYTKMPEFSGWHYLTIFITTILAKDMTLHLKEFLQEMFANTINKNNETHFYIMMIVVRAMSYSKKDNLGSYAHWYKLTIGEMNYKIKSNDFKYIMSILTNMAAFEGDPEIIKIHINTSISAPPLCNELVFHFKQISKNHLINLSQKRKRTYLSETTSKNYNFSDEIILIDD